MNTITLKFLQAQVDRLNRVTNSPMESYVQQDGRCIGQIGNYHLSGAYGGYALHRMETTGGGVSDVFQCGHTTKRDLSNRISAMLCGIEASQPVNA